jgi:hypothetical protein
MTADYGLMIWDGKSAGTILNILRLLRAGRKAVLVNSPARTATNFKTLTDWANFFSRCPPGFRDDVRKRATPAEWLSFEPAQQTSFLDSGEGAHTNIGHAGSDLKSGSPAPRSARQR